MFDNIPRCQTGNICCANVVKDRICRKSRTQVDYGPPSIAVPTLPCSARFQDNRTTYFEKAAHSSSVTWLFPLDIAGSIELSATADYGLDEGQHPFRCRLVGTIIDACERPLQSKGILVVRNARAAPDGRRLLEPWTSRTIATTSWPSHTNLQTTACPHDWWLPMTGIIVPLHAPA